MRVHDQRRTCLHGEIQQLMTELGRSAPLKEQVLSALDGSIAAVLDALKAEDEAVARAAYEDRSGTGAATPGRPSDVGWALESWLDGVELPRIGTAFDDVQNQHPRRAGARTAKLFQR